jgi:hypothetical protein
LNWTQFLQNEIESTYTTTARLIDRVGPGSLGWKPESGSNWMTVGQLLMHISSACGVGFKGFVTGDWSLPGGKKLEDLSPEEMMPPAEKMPSVKSVEEARKLLEEDKALALRMIDQAGEHDLATQEMDAPWNPGEPTILGCHLLRMIQHLESHKSQLFYYLKLQGKAVSTADLWG